MRQLFFLLGVIATCVPFARGAIVVGANGSGILSFATRPAASEWSTKSITGLDVLFVNSNDLGNAVQTNASAVSISAQLADAGAANPPGQNTVAAWSSGGTGGLWTRPTANGATLLMATLMNATGAEQNALRIAYTLGQSGGTPAEQAPAHQVYYSFSGELGSWVNIPGLSGGSIGARSNVVVFATPWTNGAPLYVLWIDDNATGGVDRGYSIDDVSFVATTGLSLEVIPDAIVDVLSTVSFHTRITESNGPGTRFTYSLEPDAPSGVLINQTNGLILWRPSRADAGTTNSITVRVTEIGAPTLTATQRFTVVVRDYAEVFVGSVVVDVGQRTNILIESISTVPLSNLAFSVLLPTDRLATLALEDLAPSVVSGALDASQPNRISLTFAALPGQSFTGTQQLARLHFTAVSQQTSAFIGLQPIEVAATLAEAGPAPTLLANEGRVVTVNGQPLLEAFQTGSGRVLALYGRTGTNYLLETSINFGVSWQSWQSVTLSNLLQFIDASVHSNAPAILYRALEGNVPPPSLLPQAPGEFKAAAKLNKRKVAAALKRLKRMQSHMPWPPDALIP